MYLGTKNIERKVSYLLRNKYLFFIYVKSVINCRIDSNPTFPLAELILVPITSRT